jgi:hypothetical protein
MINSIGWGFAGVLIIELVFGGCSNMDLKLKCRHDVLAVAMALDEKYIVLIEVGQVKNGLAWHSQVKARVDGEWQYYWRFNDNVVETVDILVDKRTQFEIPEYVKYIRYKQIELNLSRSLEEARKVFP